MRFPAPPNTGLLVFRHEVACVLVEMEMEQCVRHGAVHGTVDCVGVLVEALICLFVYLLYIYILGEGGLEGEARLGVGVLNPLFCLRVVFGQLTQRTHIWVVLHQFVKPET